MSRSAYQSPEPALGEPAVRSPFASDFEGVRVHQGAPAPALGAQAFVQGADPALAARGPDLLGHEAVHVVQQRTGVAQARADLFGDQY